VAFCNAKQLPTDPCAATALWTRPHRDSPRARQRRLHSLICCVALPHAAQAVRITAQITRAQRRVNTLLYCRVPGEPVDEIGDEIIALRTRLMNKDMALMTLVQQARRANERRPERDQLDLDTAFRAMASVKGEEQPERRRASRCRARRTALRSSRIARLRVPSIRPLPVQDEPAPGPAHLITI
jgi:hypothetical protein